MRSYSNTGYQSQDCISSLMCNLEDGGKPKILCISYDTKSWRSAEMAKMSGKNINRCSSKYLESKGYTKMFKSLFAPWNELQLRAIVADGDIAIKVYTPCIFCAFFKTKIAFLRVDPYSIHPVCLIFLLFLFYFLPFLSIFLK